MTDETMKVCSCGGDGYVGWFDVPERICPRCKGTGMIPIHDTDSGADWAADWAAVWAAAEAAGWAAAGDAARVADWAAVWAAVWAAEREWQIVRMREYLRGER